ncbi:O-antigen polysaccharide polymerase Wzy [Mycolicibacterium vaccae]|uniref:O-antigen polysaccharide polymerase Wzy n=1 Tax=Mycolicibacterium vaccae TaxID=1810 RepID=UPI000303EDCC|nr:O-antigen polysaccharide polymerase Wzy [Mycolicibacterium vaccae]
MTLLVAYVGAPLGADAPILWACLVLHYALIIASVWKPSRVYRGLPTFVTAEFLFLFFAYLIYFLPYQLFLLDINDLEASQRFPGKAFSDQSNHAILLASIGMVSFRAGLRYLRPNSTLQRTNEHKRVTRLDALSADSLALPVLALQILLIAFYLAFGFKAEAEGRYTDSTAGGNFAEGIYTGITVLCMVAVALILTPNRSRAAAAPKSIFLWAAAGVALLWAGRILLAGDRNSFLLIGIVALGGIFTFRVRIGRWALVTCCAIALVMYNAIEQFRKGRVDSLMQYAFGEAASGTASADSSFNISTISVRAALANVPEYFDYGYGLYKLVGLAGVIPFIRGAVIPPEMPFTQSSDVLVMILLGPSATWGVGTNVIADIYMDFGLFGVPILLFLVGLGVAYTRVSLINHPDSPWRAVFYLVTLALVAELPRYSLTFPVRPLVWVFLLFWAVAVLTPAIRQQHPSRGHHRRRAAQQRHQAQI